MSSSDTQLTVHDILLSPIASEMDDTLDKQQTALLASMHALFLQRGTEGGESNRVLPMYVVR